MSDISKEAFDYQCECNLSYISNSDKVTVEIGQQHLKDIFATLMAERDALQAERDDADRRAGAAERRNADEIAELRDTHSKRKEWLRKAKESRGYGDYTSFDRVWADTCKAADERDALRAKVARMEAALVECRDELDAYSQQEYPGDHPVHESYRKRDYYANPARKALEEDND